jgi:mRNA interferase RelE/StbE
MYDIQFEQKASKSFNKLERQAQLQIGKKIEQLKTNPHIGKPLIGNLSGYWKLRIGKYRAIYQRYEGKLIIIVLDIGHRKNIY